MLKIFKEAMQAGNATVKYPFAPLPVIEDSRGKPEQDPAKCIVCAACAVACPSNAIQMSADTDKGTMTWEINYGRCIFCGRCEEVCPTHAIVLGHEFELAVTSFTDLVSTSVFALQRCEICGDYYAPAKQVQFAEQALEHSMGLDDNEVLASKRLMHWCPTCKARYDAGVLSPFNKTEHPNGETAAIPGDMACATGGLRSDNAATATAREDSQQAG